MAAALVALMCTNASQLKTPLYVQYVPWCVYRRYQSVKKHSLIGPIPILEVGLEHTYFEIVLQGH